MMLPSHEMRIVVVTRPVDFRKGHDGLAALISNVIGCDPFDGTVFVFRSKRLGRLKMLYWDGSGLVMSYKRLEDHSLPGPQSRTGSCDWITHNLKPYFQGSIGDASWV